MAVRIMRGMEDLVASGSQLVWSLAHQTLRRWYNRGLMPCRRLLEAWFRIGKCYQMTEGRLCQVHLLDGRKLELLVQPKLLARELLDLVASHFILKEKEYFGLCFIDDTGQKNWLHLDHKVLDHDFSKSSGPLEVQFLVRFYIEKITFLKESTTVELFFLNAKSLVFNETIEVESENVFKLAAFALQEAKGDYTSTDTATSDLKQLPVLPTRVLREHPSLNYCEDRVVEHYKKLKGLTRGQAIVRYLALVESLPTYGVHYYPVKDKQGIPWWLGVSYKGIGQYDLQDKLKPRKLFQWKQLENLYFREKKFAVEVNDPHRRTVTKRTFGQTGLVIHSWYASHSLIKTIWVMAISQHQFYLDSKQSKSKMTSTRSSADIAMDLTEICVPRISKLSNVDGKDPLIMASNGSLVSAGSADSEVSEEQKKEKMAELKKKEKDLKDTLTQKLEELKKICMREAELTGRLPKEYPLATGEKAPQVRRRVGTAFRLDDLFPYDEDPHLRNLESRFALQQKIVEAAMKLANEDDLCKTVKRKRRNNYQDAMRKLEEIEKEINTYRIRKGRMPTQRASLILADDGNPSDLSSLSDSLTLDDDDELGSQRQRSRSVQYSPRPHHADTLDTHYNKDRRSSANDQLTDNRLNYGEESVHYSHSDALSSCSSSFKPASRKPRDTRSMPPTPLLTRNAYSSTQLRSEDAPQHFRQRSGSLESQSHLMIDAKPPIPTVTVSPARRSNSTEVLDDGSSYTSQSSVEYSVPGNHGHRLRARGRHRKDIYANTGSMPNLAQPDTRCYAYQPRARPTTTAYYVTGYTSCGEPEPYPNGAYMYENEMEGHYNVNPSYPHTQAAYHDMHGHYASDEMDGFSQNPYATLRPPRNRLTHRSTEQVSKNIQRALVAEHLKGWYQRNTAPKQPTYNYDYDRGSQQQLGYQSMHPPYSNSSRTVSYSSVSAASSSGNWHTLMSGRGMSEYDMPAHELHSYSYSAVAYNRSTHNRSFIDVNQMDPHTANQTHANMDPDDRIYWHEDSKPGTIV
ncbi:FERM domain-containing protein 4B isoform X2 [Melanotaenia boesemani]|uniref:FERM domain-containing protein 4B isoform X2 n=1 Tax=Melanotaenia boesemani TaxID=1250792 RepID=UPI001C03DB37|nr:FERM domain-containing protein 4B isoform X2 [Melanotaenia boesemani]